MMGGGGERRGGEKELNKGMPKDYEVRRTYRRSILFFVFSYFFGPA